MGQTGEHRAHTKNRSPQNNNNDIERFVSNIDIGRNETAERMGRAGKLRETGACALLSAGTRSFGRELSRCVNLEHLLHDIPPSRSSRPGESRSGGRLSVWGSVQGAIAELTERRLASAQADTFENHQRSRASLAMASGAMSEQEQGEFLMASGAISEQQVGVRTSLRRPPALKIKIQRKVAQHGGIGKTESGSGSGSGIEAGAEAE